MSFFCLYCLSELPSNNPHGCNYTNHNFRTVVPKKDLSALTTRISADTCHTVTDFNPSTRDPESSAATKGEPQTPHGNSSEPG